MMLTLGMGSKALFRLTRYLQRMIIRFIVGYCRLIILMTITQTSIHWKGKEYDRNFDRAGS